MDVLQETFRRKKETIIMENKLFTRDFTLVVIGQIISLFGNSVCIAALFTQSDGLFRIIWDGDGVCLHTGYPAVTSRRADC